MPETQDVSYSDNVWSEWIATWAPQINWDAWPISYWFLKFICYVFLDELLGSVDDILLNVIQECIAVPYFQKIITDREGKITQSTYTWVTADSQTVLSERLRFQWRKTLLLVWGAKEASHVSIVIAPLSRQKTALTTRFSPLALLNGHLWCFIMNSTCGCLHPAPLNHLWIQSNWWNELNKIHGLWRGGFLQAGWVASSCWMALGLHIRKPRI